ncbi:MAG: cellulase family glycosylhydrolase [Lentisphaerae bacterium]|nr:cellulase family glycosylhydrolase [Lentisphaerota bacterium]
MKQGHNILKSALIAALLSGGAALAGDKIVPNFEGGEPKMGSAHYGFQRASQEPCVYRGVFKANPTTEGIALRVQTGGPIVVRLNGFVVYEFQAKAGAPSTTQDIFISEWIKPGQNVLAVSGAPQGLALDGAIIDRDGSLRRLASTHHWRVKKFQAYSFLQEEPALRNAADPLEGWATVQAQVADGVHISDQELRALATPALKQARAELARNLAWRQDMLFQRGCIIDDWETFAFGDASRLSDEALEVARALQEGLRQMTDAEKSSRAIHSIADGMDALGLAVRLLDEAECLHNTASVIQSQDPQSAKIARAAADQFRTLGHKAFDDLLAGKYTAAYQTLSAARPAIESAFRAVEDSWKNVVNRLNQADANRFGWLDITHMLDNDVTHWGLRIGEVDVSWKMYLGGLWRFKLDPQNSGLKATYHDPAYNLDHLWSEILVPGDWEHQGFHDQNPDIKKSNPFPGVNDILTDGPYNGWAWYRYTLHIPQEWAGYDLELYLGCVDDYDWTYFNGQEIGHTAYDTNPKDFWQVERTYKIPQQLVKFGGINLIAVRVYDCRDKGGIMGEPEIRCPGLKDVFEKNQAGAQKVKPSTVWSSPLSIGALVTAGADPLTLWGWNERGVAGPQAIGFPAADGLTLKPLTETGVIYDAQVDGELSENWLLLWPTEESLERPLLIVLLDKPRQIAATVGEKGTSKLELTFGREKARLLLARPLREEMPLGSSVPAEAVERCRFWSQALLAYPVAFTEINARRRDDPWVLDVTDVYTYKLLSDAWNTQPIRVALLPAFFSYAVASKFPGVAWPQAAEDLGYALGKYGRLQGVKGTNQVTYQVPIDNLPAFGGTTAFAFSPADIGTGNILEVQEVALYGGNSWRPQTQVGPGAGLEHCLEAGRKYGVNILHNTSADFAGGYDKIPALYGRLAEAYKDLPFTAIAYDPFNEPAGVLAADYAPLVRDAIAAIRQHDKRHLIYIESPESFAAVTMLDKIEPLDDPLAIYSFHDYDYRLYEFWPNERASIRAVLQGWFRAFELMIERHARMHLGEWGGYEQRAEPWVYTRPHTIAQTLDMCRIFQHFHIHFHYYSNRGILRAAADGSAYQSYVQEGFRRFFARGHWNYYQQPSE